MADEPNEAVIRKIVDFLTGIGLEVIATRLDPKTFLPGIQVEKGKILFDRDKLTYPGDLLHEAGHLALATGEVRPTLSGEVILPDAPMESVEVSAIAWSYAAILHLELDPTIVFHQGGYRGASDKLMFNFSLGVYVGIGGLQDAGLTAIGDKARELDVLPYPRMIKWLRD